MAFFRSGKSAVPEDTDDLLNPLLTEDGLDLGQFFPDRVFFTYTAGNTDSPDDFALLKFDGIFGEAEGQSRPRRPSSKRMGCDYNWRRKQQRQLRQTTYHPLNEGWLI